MEGMRGIYTGWTREKEGARAHRIAMTRGRGTVDGTKTHCRWSELEPAGNAMHTVTPCDTLQI